MLLGVENYRNKHFSYLALTAVFNVEVADDAKHNGTDQINDQILHGIDKPDIQIAAQPQGLAIEIYFIDTADSDRDIAASGVDVYKRQG